jgi:hypothetical protein
VWSPICREGTCLPGVGGWGGHIEQNIAQQGSPGGAAGGLRRFESVDLNIVRKKSWQNDSKMIINSLGRETMANSCMHACFGNSTVKNDCLNFFLKIYSNVQSPVN